VEIEVLIFECDGDRFGVPASQVSEVVRAVAVSPTPQTPEFVLGVINLRGELVTVVDARMLLSLPKAEIHHSHQFVILNCRGGLLALHVDRAIDLINAEHTNEAKDSSSDQGDGQGFVDGTVNTELGIVPILSAERLLSDQDTRSIRIGAIQLRTGSSTSESN
jgi:purine-binding chemotaxis protein CheW